MTAARGGVRETATGGRLRIGLFDPGMTPIHRAGLAGLWMTLAELEKAEHADAKRTLEERGGSWRREPQAVEFEWSGDGRAFFSELIRLSFRLTADGRFWFLGLGNPNDHQDGGTVLQAAVLETFLQHGKTRKADPPPRPSGQLVLEIDGRHVPFRYRKVESYAHRDAGEKFQLSRPLEVAGWLLPGGAVRHAAFSAQTNLVETPGLWLALLYAPVGSIYFRIRRAVRGIRPQFCLVVPDLDDLERYQRSRHLFLKRSVQDLVAAGAADAALRVLAALEAEGLIATGMARRCHVFAFGIAPWSPQQRTRVDRYTVEVARAPELHLYRKALQLLPAVASLPTAADGPNGEGAPPEGQGRGRGRRKGTDAVAEPRGPDGDDDGAGGEVRWEVSPLLDLMARNVAEGRPWWAGVTGLVRAPDTWAQWRRYERALAARRRGSSISTPGGIAAMVTKEDAFSNKAEEAIVKACQEAWRRRLGALSERARSRGERFQDLAERERERLRIAFAHCKNAETLRAALVDFWSRAGPIPILHEHWRDILPFLGPERWQLARDLALLALVSYAPQEDRSEPNGQADLGGDDRAAGPPRDS